MTERNRGYDKYLDPPAPSRNCARAGCGHQPRWHDLNADGDGYCIEHVEEVDTPLYQGPIRCSCPGYRTQAQQEAWIALEEGWCDCGGALSDAARRLLELYP